MQEMKQYFSVLPDAWVGEISIFFILFLKDMASAFLLFYMEIFETNMISMNVLEYTHTYTQMMFV